ncbi:hypothetical protein [Pedobacter sp. ASV12]|uniref:hypothetical protein n=1 Tax=Pedobacter sp. ASV12 TaxID=2795120 RepID=UPI0018EE0622|nr:hypothetical protein [Pedobacter sp. ASV12]
MKKINLLLPLMAISLAGFAQVNDYPSTGNPTIYGYSPIINLKRNTNEGGYLQGIQTLLQNGTPSWFFGNQHDEGPWIVSRGEYTNAKLAILPNGNIGIGTISPLQKFVVSDQNQDGLEVYLRQPLGVVGLQAYNRANSAYVKLQMDASQFAFTGGNVGIGTVSPNYPLTVNGSVKLVDGGMGYLINYASLSETLGGLSTILGNNVANGATNNTIRKTINPYDASSFISLNYIYGITFHTGITGPINTDMPVENSEKMRITQNGNLLIGKTSQANNAYKLDVNGKARANEIVVNTTGADFVFENNYRLRPLAEVEKFIKENKHLPEIPTAKAMQQEGVGVSELQTKLLQKVEELTLYIIQQQKEIDELKKKLNK